MTDISTTLSNAIQQLGTTSDSADLDAEVLLSHVLNKPRSHLRAWPEKILSSQQTQHYQQLIEQRYSGMPVAYLTGQREFWSRDFMVSPDVLIPRPDTELLIELSLNLLKHKPNARVLDLGTGSGIIAITLAAERPGLTVFATDICAKALSIAKNNATKHRVNNVHFLQSNWFNAIERSTFDLIISNPPYIKENDPHLSEGDVRFEPEQALTAAESGLKDIKLITKHGRNYLKPDATLLIEHGYDQQTSVQNIFNMFNFENIKTHPDLAGHPRVTSGQWKLL